jgi:cytoskeletal protein CcmA (bactofilin family)
MEIGKSGATMSLVSENITIDGDLEGTENILVNGRIKGSLRLNGDIIIGPYGVLEAEVEGNNIVIQGTVKGNVKALEHLEIQSSGRMIGDITARSIDIKEGSTFEGRSQMIKTDRPRPSAPVSEAPSQPSAESSGSL